MHGVPSKGAPFTCSKASLCQDDVAKEVLSEMWQTAQAAVLHRQVKCDMTAQQAETWVVQAEHKASYHLHVKHKALQGHAKVGWQLPQTQLTSGIHLLATELTVVLIFPRQLFFAQHRSL